MAQPVIVRIAIYPIKSLDPVELHEVSILESGRLWMDREFALFDEKSRVVNGKRESRIHKARAYYNLDRMEVTLSACGLEEETYSLEKETGEIARWFTRFLGYPVELRRNSEEGFPDDLEANGPTVISTGTLVEVTRWFPGLSLGEARLRFRANLEVGALEPFWEERLLGEEGPQGLLRIGEGVYLEPRGVSRRCVVPSRHPCTGRVMIGFQKRFVEMRSRNPPPRAGGNLYRLALNTVVARGAGRVIKLMDPVEVVSG